MYDSEVPEGIVIELWISTTPASSITLQMVIDRERSDVIVMMDSLFA